MAISISGFNGIDTETLITQLMYLEEAPLRRLEQDKQDIQSKISAWQSLNTALDTFKTKAGDLSDIFGKMATTIDNEDILTATTNSSATSGTYEIEVKQLFQAHTVASGEQVLNDTVSGSFDLNINGYSMNIDVTDANLHDIAEKINNTTIDHDGDDNTDEIHLAQASVVDGKIVLQASEEVVGKGDNTNQLSFANETNSILSTLKLDTINVDTVQNHQMAQFTVNGLIVERGSNKDIDDVIKGVTLNLEKVSEEGETATVSIGTDKKAMKEKIEVFVNQYNSLIDTLGKYGQADETQIENGSGAAVLSGDATLRSIESMMYNSVMNPSNTISSAEWLSDTPLSWDTGAKNLVINGTTTVSLNGSDSLEDIVDKINVSGADVTASIKDNRLAIESNGSRPVDLSGSDSVVLRDLQIPEKFETNMASLLGIEIDRYGKLSIDEDKLDDALSDNLSDVKQMFAGVGGVIDRVETNVEMAIKSYSSTDGGYISNRINSLQNEIKYINEDIESTERRLELREIRLKSQFSQMDQLLSQLNNQSSWLDSQVSGLYS